MEVVATHAHCLRMRLNFRPSAISLLHCILHPLCHQQCCLYEECYVMANDGGRGKARGGKGKGQNQRHHQRLGKGQGGKVIARSLCTGQSRDRTTNIATTWPITSFPITFFSMAVLVITDKLVQGDNPNIIFRPSSIAFFMISTLFAMLPILGVPW